MKKFLEFISYHNAVPIFFGILFLGSGAAFAASPEAREAVFDAQTTVTSVDNSYIVAVDVSTYQFNVHIDDVYEDEDSYFVAYSMNTIDLDDGAWRDVQKKNTLTVAKATLGERDLGVYVTKQLSEVRDAERRRITETQYIERKVGAKNKVVATVYSGLVGSMLKPHEEVLDGYSPIITEPEVSVATNTGEVDSPSSSPIANTSAAPHVTVLGNNPAQIAVGDVYADLGALVQDDKDNNLGIHVFLDEKEVRTVTLDTSVDTTYSIVYRATDQDGNVGEAVRTVIVGVGTIDAEVEEVKGEDEFLDEDSESVESSTSTPMLPDATDLASTTPDDEE